MEFISLKPFWLNWLFFLNNRLVLIELGHEPVNALGVLSAHFLVSVNVLEMLFQVLVSRGAQVLETSINVSGKYFESCDSLPTVCKAFHFGGEQADVGSVGGNLFKGLPVKTGVLPLEGEVTELVELLPNFLNLLGIAQDLDLVVVNVEDHLLVILVVVGTKLVVAGLKSGDSVLMIVHSLGQVFENLPFVAF